MAVRVALNGFGRIGRNIFRVLYDREDIEVAAICDVATPEQLVYLLKYDSISGPFKEPLEIVNGKLSAQGRLIPFVEGKKPGDVNWRRYDVDIVIEASGRYRSREVLEKHLEAGARRVVLSSPSSGPIDATIIHGVNDSTLNADSKIVSTGSISLNALVPVLHAIDRAFPIEEAFYNLVHAYTNEMSLADVSNNFGHEVMDDAPDDDLRRSRSAPMNIIPASTKQPVQLGGFLPHLKGRIGGMALSAAVPDGSCIDLTTFHKGTFSAAELNAVMRSAAATTHDGCVMEFCDEPIVSLDVSGNPHSAIFDSLMTSVIPDPESENRRSMVKTLTWYDNGWSFAHRVVDLVATLSKTL